MKVKSTTDATKLTDEEKTLEIELFKALKSKDKEKLRAAYSNFYTFYSLYLRKLCHKKLDNMEDTCDLLMDTFIAFFNSLINDRINECFKSYLMTIFNLKCNKYNEENKKHRKMMEEVYDISEIAEYHDNYIDRLNISTYIDSILTKVEKEILLRHIVRGESLVHIKQKLNLVKKDIHKIYKGAIKKLRKGMEEDFDE